MVLRFAAVMHRRNVLGIPVGIPVPAAPAHSFDWAFEGASHIEACTRSMSTDIVTQQDRRGVSRLARGSDHTYVWSGWDGSHLLIVRTVPDDCVLN